MAEIKLDKLNLELQELDSKKSLYGEVGYNAREAIRILESIRLVDAVNNDLTNNEETRWVTFYYNSMKKKVSNLKVHSDKKSAFRYFNENGSWIHSRTKSQWYFITSIEKFKEAFNYSTDEVLRLAESEE